MSAPGRTPLAVELPTSLVEAVAERAAELVLEGEQASREPDPWIGVEQAAAHLGCPTSRVYALSSAKRIPVERDGSRLIFKRSALDAWVRAGGAKRP